MSTTSWTPAFAHRPGPAYRALADALAEDLGRGLLLAGDRLPPQRELAKRLGLTAVTVGRAYREAARRGLVRATVGRGTEVLGGPGGVGARSPVAGGSARERVAGSLSQRGDELRVGSEAASGTALAVLAAIRGEADASGAIDLAANHLPPPAELLAAVFDTAIGRLMAARMLRYDPPGGLAEDRAALASWVGRPEFTPTAATTLATAGGQHAMLVALATITRPGDVLLVEELVYPGIKALASHLHLRPIAVPIDREGLVPEALRELAVGHGARAVYCQPTLANPTAATMGSERRGALAELARRHDLWLVEDDVYGFLHPTAPPPLASFAPERSLYLASAAKAIAPGLRVGVLVAPEALIPRLAAEICGTVWFAAPSLVGLLARLVADGTAARVVEWKRAEIAARQRIFAGCFSGLRVETHPAASHAFVAVPEPWQVGELVSAARARGVLVVAGETFTTRREPPPHAVRVCLGAAADRPQLTAGLTVVADLLRAAPPPVASVV